MKSNLFFEGPVRSGKSTVLRRALLPYLDDLGGFVVQRLLNPKGAPVAYRLMGMNEIRQMGAGAEALFLSVDAPYPEPNTEAKSNIFLWTSPWRFDAKVFETYGLDCLQASKERKIVLLDEIGGVDLLTSVFRAKLQEVLGSPTPCIGVIKELDKARDALLFNRELRALLIVTYLSSGNLLTISEIIQSFLASQRF